LKATLEVINQMQADGVIGKYAIGGAVGATFYLPPSATVDVDIFATIPSQAEPLLNLSPIYEYLKARGCREEDEYIVVGDWPVQFLPPSDELDREAIAESVSVEIEGTRTWVMTAEHLVAIALRTGRPKDRSRVLQFFEQEAVDRTKLQRIIQQHGLISKWNQFKQRYVDCEHE
jgi:hypothetical protein